MSQVPLRFHRLRLMSRSAAHYAAAIELPQSADVEIGSAADRLILGGGRVLVYPGPVRRGHQYDAFVEDNPDALIVTAKEGAQALGIAEAVEKCPDAVRLLTGVRQETLYWSFSGRECRGTPDVRGDGFITDLKTGETSDPRFFPFKVKRFAYHAQAAFYEQGCAMLGHDVTESYIVCVEQAPPHVVTVFRLTPNLVEMGDRLWRLWFEQLMVCEASDAWPPYSQSIVDLEFPDDDQLIEVGSAELVETTA